MNIQFFDDPAAAALIRSDTHKNLIELWTTRRLPIEPKGALLAARDYLRAELRKISAFPQSILNARYVSTTTGFVDTENVLLYNVGPSAFASASRYGLLFTREFAEPPKAPHEDANWSHYHEYALAPITDLKLDALVKALFTFELPRLSSSLRPHDIWWAAKQGLAHIDSELQVVTRPYAMSINLAGPIFHGNNAALVKPLFDGVISALHFDPKIQPESAVCALLATALRRSPEEVANALSTPRNAVFGARTVVAPYRGFIKWNPADELCLTGKLNMTQFDSTNWLIGVAMSPLDENSPCR